MDLHEVGTGRVPKATGALGVQREWSLACKEIIESAMKISRILDQHHRSVGGSEREWRSFRGVLGHEVARLGGSVATPS
jgi:hypothetical protein